MKGRRLKISLIYIGIGITWIILSDAAVSRVSYRIDDNLLHFLRFGKGIFFILCSGFILFLSMGAEAEKLELKRTGEILSKINNPVIISNAEGIVIWVNPAFSAVTGYLENEVLGEDHLKMLYNSKTNKVIAQQLLRAVSRKESFSADLVNYDKTNKEYWVTLNIYPIFDAQGKFECYISVQNDITEHKEKEAMIGIQSEKLKAVSWLNSHQIRKPVASILALVQLVKSSDDEEEKLELLDLLYRCTVELDDIIMEINAEASGHIQVK
ncbi:PAS domain-containing protein [Pedobacter hartonius]|uniref:PAS domain S-box-containing protein n=1 Tax=Pedobacter hartonius TaxID=425514 RepID=A0A1H3W8R7_9SPHI|nr:PAS domain-containing protein [Pedobacter hartonius]SDZ83493.1 PAS domain S-box-containing protein [Pedobacter hartonius]